VRRTVKTSRENGSLGERSRPTPRFGTGRDSWDAAVPAPVYIQTDASLLFNNQEVGLRQSSKHLLAALKEAPAR